MAYRRIVVATDGSASAETAERAAIALAATAGASLTVVHAYSSPGKAPEAVERVMAIAEEAAVHTEVVLSSDAPADAVIETADARDAEVIVIGSVGLAMSDRLFGSVSRRVVTHAPCDVLLTRVPRANDRPPTDPPYRRILIATDGSSTADRAARKGYALAGRMEASVTLLFVGHPKTGELILQDTVSTIGEEVGVTSATEIRSGDPVREIVDAVAVEAYDLVVVGNRGMSGAKAALLGSVPRDVAEQSSSDVLVARTVAQNLSEIGPGEGGVVADGDHKVAVYRDAKGNVTTLSAKCTHLGCTVKWSGADETWVCPCHGSRFAPTGEVVNGPADRPLERTTL
ncbi:MAG: universal stress protein [Actinobacteria bacterium]|nr:universal stress protein [Actinomycetota bacterium]